MSDQTPVSEQRWNDAAHDDRWWKYLVLEDYDLRERTGYTAAEAGWRFADWMHVASDRVSAAASRLHNWGAQ